MRINENLLYQQIGERIRQQRVRVNLTQEQLAEAIGVLRTSITNLEAGRQRVPLHVLYELCVVLDVDLTEILPKQEEIIQISLESIEIGGRVTSVPPESAKFLQKLIKE